MKKISTILCLILTVHLLADNPKSREVKYPYNYGKMEDTIYVNPFFKLRMPIPSTWTIQNKTQIDFAVSKGKEFIEFKDENTQKTYDKIDIKSMTLLMVSKYEMGAPVEFNPNLIIMAEDVSMYPGIKKGADYLFQVKKQFKNDVLGFDVSPEYDTILIADDTFDILKASKTDAFIYTEYLCSIQKRYAFSIIITYTKEEERNEILDFVKKIQFTE